MTLPDYNYCLSVWKRQFSDNKSDHEKLIYGFCYFTNDNRIEPTKWTVGKNYNRFYYIIPGINDDLFYYNIENIPNEQDFNKLLKDLLLQIKLRNIDKDF